ncbi:MAG: helix-turn-helix transcriptional regulator [Nocardiaceae bacterium]|nr:helix-turn-helix transcriptional regulator [Nocardiaceae bacterium]
MSNWWEYVIRTAKTDVQKQMASDTGISETAFSRWKKGQNKPEAPHVITFARAYARPPVEALVAAGILAEADANDVIEVHRGLDDLTDEELVSAIQDRMRGMRDALEAAQKSDAQAAVDEDEEEGLTQAVLDLAAREVKDQDKPI